MTVSKGKISWTSETFVDTVNTFYLYCGMQSVRSVQDCTLVLYEPSNCCYTYIHKHIYIY